MTAGISRRLTLGVTLEPWQRDRWLTRFLFAGVTKKIVQRGRLAQRISREDIRSRREPPVCPASTMASVSQSNSHYLMKRARKVKKISISAGSVADRKACRVGRDHLLNPFQPWALPI